MKSNKKQLIGFIIVALSIGMRLQTVTSYLLEGEMNVLQ